MSYRWGRGSGRRDHAEAAILQALKAVGAEYWQLSGTGNPDVLARWQGQFYAAEIKTGTAKETKNQGAFPIWRTPDDALKAIGVIR